MNHRFSIALLLIALLASACYAANCRVTKTADTNDGACTAGDCSLREAVAEPSCPMIDFSLGLVGHPVTITLGDIVISRTVGIKGYGADAITIASNNVFRIFYIAGSGNATITGLTLTGGGGNGTGTGGGGAIRNGGGSLVLNGVYLTGNSSQGGSAVSGNALIVNSTISGNVSGAGQLDAALAPGTSLIIYNSTVCDNTGPGIASTGFVYSINSTIAFNGPTGVLMENQGTLTTGNSIIIGFSNGGHINGGTISSQGNNIGSYAPGAWPVGFIGTDQVGVDPMVGPLGYYGGRIPTRPILAGSPGIDRGNDQTTGNAPLTMDQRGFLRFFDGDGNGPATVDIGAFEFGAPFAAAVTVSGRVLAPSGNPLRSVSVIISDLQGNSRSVLTSSLGWFVFEGMQADRLYKLSISSKRYSMTPAEKPVFADHDLTDADITVDADPPRTAGR